MLKTHYWLNNCQEQYLKASSFSFEVNIMNSNLEKAKATNFKADGRKKYGTEGQKTIHNKYQHQRR